MSTLDSAHQTTTTRGGRSTRARQIFVPGSKSSMGECWGADNQPGNVSAATASPSKKELENLGTDIYYDVLKYHYHWKHSANKSLSGPSWNLYNPHVPSKERVETVSKFTGYEAVAIRFKQDDENLERFLKRCGHDHAEMMARNMENNKKRKERPSTITTASAEEQGHNDDDDNDDDSTVAMGDGSSSQDGGNNETNPAPITHRRVRRRDPTAARVSLSPSGSRSARREDPPASGETMEERIERIETLLKTAMDRINALETTVEDLKAGH